jgi:arylsulfatase A-like enzyme
LRYSSFVMVRFVGHGGGLRWTVVLVLGLAVLVVLLGWFAHRRAVSRVEPFGPPRAARDEGALDVVLVVVDTERWDRTNPGGFREDTTPFLTEIASRGVTFTHAFAPAPWTVPSMNSLMTGLWPAEHGMVEGQALGFEVVDQKVLPPAATTLAELLRAEGYETFGVCTNFHLGPRFGFDQGFDHFVGEDFAFMPFPNMVLESLAPRIRASGRYFLWLHYFDPHHPYMQRQPWFDRYNESDIDTYEQLGLRATMAYFRLLEGIGPDEELSPAEVVRYYDLAGTLSLKPMILFRRLKEAGIVPDDDWKRFLAASYASEIRMTDEAMREALVSKLGVDDRTVLVVTSDHGEELWERGDWGHRVSDSLHQELIHVPLVVTLPGFAHAGEVVRTPVSLVDLMPTILELAGAEVPGDLPGRSLLAIIEGQDPPDRALFSEVHSDMGVSRCIVEYPYKYIHSFTLDRGELYDLEADPGEREDLSSSRPALARRMREDLMAWYGDREPRFEVGEAPPLSPEQIMRLRLLGYVE